MRARYAMILAAKQLEDALAETERLRAALKLTRDFIGDQPIAHALVGGDGSPDTWPSLLQVIDKALGAEQQGAGK